MYLQKMWKGGLRKERKEKKVNFYLQITKKIIGGGRGPCYK